MLLRPFLNDAGSCASYLFGCTTHRKLAVADPHVDLVDEYVTAAAAIGSPITAVFEAVADRRRGDETRWLVDALLAELPLRPAEQERIVAANRSGEVAAAA